MDLGLVPLCPSLPGLPHSGRVFKHVPSPPCTQRASVLQPSAPISRHTAGKGAGNELHSRILPGGGPQASQSHGALRQIPERVFFGAVFDKRPACGGSSEWGGCASLSAGSPGTFLGPGGETTHRGLGRQLLTSEV